MDGWIKSIKTGVGTVQRKVREHQIESSRKAARAVTQSKALRQRSLPIIRGIAREYGAQVDPLDTAAYVHKMTGPGGHEERGVHIPYGIPASKIRTTLEKTFTKSALASKLVHGAKHLARDVKKTKKALGEIRKELKGSLGGGSSLYPPIKWG